MAMENSGQQILMEKYNVEKKIKLIINVFSIILLQN